ncbi:hypothetical protein L1049_016443 [Liquidambar formosana]|uniref:NADH dehydrogenase [ubiquinone] 1 alpha subcomplex assembly factor 4 n=1 Tax=Liquidambar formosana TaxID=63359 RepID=A0AAP0S1D6_LIQFO
MGQAFRRATGRIQNTSLESSSKLKNAGDRMPPAVPVDKVEVSKAGDNPVPDSEGASRIGADNVLEERDPQYDVMLNQMVGRIRSKPGGKLEMGEAFVVEKYNRPMPKLRDTKPESGRYEEKPVPPGTLNVAQLRHIILLHQGKADDHDGPMEVQQIAEKFRVDAVQVQQILRVLSLPPEDSNKQKNNQ